MNRRRLALICLILMIAVVSTGCGAKKASQDMAREVVVVEKAVEAERPAGAPMPTMVASEAYGQSASDVQLATPEDRMIIQTVSLAIVVEDTDQTLTRIGQAVAQYGGYVADSSRWLRNDQPWATVTIRVPAGSLTQMRDMLKGEAIRVESENLSGQDVTEEFVDLQARLRNLEATETELLELLTEVRRNRGKAEDILAIHREITNIRGQIESLKGRSQYLERMTALATINLEIRPKAAPQSLVERASWSPLITASKALRGFVEVLQVLVDLVIYVVIFSPVILIPLALLWFLVRLIKRRKGNNKATGASVAK